MKLIPILWLRVVCVNLINLSILSSCDSFQRKNEEKINKAVKDAKGSRYIEINRTVSEIKEVNKLYAHASELNRIGDFEGAIIKLIKALKKDSNNVYLLNDIGNNYTRLEKFSEGEAFFREAISIDTSIYDSYHNLSLCYIYQRKYVNSIELLQKLESSITDPFNKGNLLTNQFIAYTYLRKCDRAKDYYKKVLELNLDENVNGHLNEFYSVVFPEYCSEIEYLLEE